MAGDDATRNGPDARERIEDAVHVAVGAALLLVNRRQVQRRRLERRWRAGRPSSGEAPDQGTDASPWS
jgi:hypothetical protein